MGSKVFVLVSTWNDFFRARFRIREVKTGIPSHFPL